MKFQWNFKPNWLSISKKWGPALRTAGYLIHRVVERWCHLNKQRQRSLACSQTNRISPNSHAFTIFASSSVIKWGKKSCFSSEKSCPTLSHHSDLSQQEVEKWDFCVKEKQHLKSVLLKLHIWVMGKWKSNRSNTVQTNSNFRYC